MHFHKQRYAKSIQQIGNFFGTIVGTRKLFFKKNTQAGGVGNQHLPLALCPFYSNIYKSSAQKQQNAEDTALQYIEA